MYYEDDFSNVKYLYCTFNIIVEQSKSTWFLKLAYNNYSKVFCCDSCDIMYFDQIHLLYYSILSSLPHFRNFLSFCSTGVLHLESLQQPFFLLLWGFFEMGLKNYLLWLA
jgi:hypothetical protein